MVVQHLYALTTEWHYHYETTLFTDLYDRSLKFAEMKMRARVYSQDTLVKCH